MSKWVLTSREDRIINLDQVIEVALTHKGEECYIRFADGTEDYIKTDALSFYTNCLNKALELKR